MVRARGAGCGASAGGGAGPAADHRGQPGGDGFMGLLRANKMNMGIQSASGENQAFSRDDFGGHANDHSIGDAGHHIRISGFADAGDQPVFMPISAL